jgi:hypothetical protein
MPNPLPGRFVIFGMISFFLAMICALGAIAFDNKPSGDLFELGVRIFGLLWFPLVVIGGLMRMSEAKDEAASNRTKVSVGPTTADLLEDAQREFRAALGDAFLPTARETFAESSFRGGFRLMLVRAADICEVVYSDTEIEVRFNGEEVFGSRVHPAFEGNVFSREHLKEYLPRIAASAVMGIRS